MSCRHPSGMKEAISSVNVMREKLQSLSLYCNSLIYTVYKTAEGTVHIPMGHQNLKQGSQTECY